MAEVLRPIEQLQLQGQFTWVLDWFGGVVDNPKDFENPGIECLLTPCTPSKTNASGVKRHLGNQVCGTVGVKAIGAIELGRQYINGQFAPKLIDLAEETILFKFEPQKPGAVQDNLLDRIGINPSAALISRPLELIGIKSPVKLVNGMLIQTNHPRSPDRHASRHQPVAFRVLFHELEIIRFYYTNSVKLVGAVFNGHFSPDRLDPCVLSTSHQGPHYSFEHKHCRFEYRNDFSSDDAILIARTLFDPTETAMRGVRRVNQSLISSKLNELNSRKTGYPRTLFPFLDEAELTLTGRRLKLANDEFIFAVSHIASCSAEFPFKDLSFQCAAQPGGTAAPDGSPEAFKGAPYQSGPGKTHGVMDSEGRPAAGSIAAESEPSVRRFTSLDLSRCKTQKYRDNTHTSSKNGWATTNLNLNKSSPGTPTAGKSNAVRQNIDDVVEGGNIPVDLGTFVAILEGLRVKHTNWRVETIPTGPESWRIPNSITTYNYFPRVLCPELTSMWRQFSFLNKAKTKRRSLICAEVAVAGRLAYLLEAERRVNEQGKYMDELPILVVWRPEGQLIERSTFEKLLAITVENPSKTWPTDTSSLSLERRRLEHGKARNVQDLIDRVSRCVQNTLAGISHVPDNPL